MLYGINSVVRWVRQVPWEERESLDILGRQTTCICTLSCIEIVRINRVSNYFSSIIKQKTFLWTLQLWSVASWQVNALTLVMVFGKGHNMLFQKILKIQHSNSNFCGLKVRELNVEAAKLTSSHPNAAQDIEWKRHELEEAWANLREQVFNVIK